MDRDRLLLQQPQAVWKEFSRIASIPRCSKHEERIILEIIRCAEERGLSWTRDRAGNLLVSLPPQKGREHLNGLIIQGHVDMVCEQNSDTCHDFENQGISLVLEGEWLRADRTTLGADNGIAVAMMLALMTGNYDHGAVDLLFTIDEETGLTGALGIDSSMVRQPLMLNIDSEEEGVFYIGCAGGKETEGNLPVHRIDVPDGFVAIEIEIRGLRGGHSGAEIHLQPGNAIKLMSRIIEELSKDHEMFIADFTGGDKHNAIPRECFVKLLAQAVDLDAIMATIAKFRKVFLSEFSEGEPGLIASGHIVETPPLCLDQKSSQALIRLLRIVPHGVISMSRTMNGLVSVSTNLASVRIHEDRAVILTSQRSDIQSLLDESGDVIANCIIACGGIATFKRSYPSWTPQPDSALLNRMIEVYNEVSNGRECKVMAIHAGLECGIIGSHRPGIQTVSFGPDIRGAHTPDERVHIKSTERTWDFLLRLLPRLNAL